MAWALFNQRYPGIATPVPIHSRGLTHEMRVFEKHDGRWKIAFFCYLDEDASLPGRMMVLLDPKGRILWQTPAATQGFESDDDLVTHLDRIFDKVGVRSQAALVRVLLSTAAPL